MLTRWGVFAADGVELKAWPEVQQPEGHNATGRSALSTPLREGRFVSGREVEQPGSGDEHHGGDGRKHQCPGHTAVQRHAQPFPLPWRQRL
jgi:hypothetical protein